MSTKNLPRIIYGTAWKKEQTASLVVTAVKQGFRAIDTACQPKHYREDLVGQALQELYEKHGFKREDLFIQTKFTPIGGQDQSKPIPYDPSSSIPFQLASSIQASFRNLGTHYVDSYLLHSPLETPAATLEAWRVMAQFRDEGKAKMIGVSNTYDVGVLEELGKVQKVDVVQNRWFQGNQWDKDVAGYCRRNGIMYQSFWTLSGSPGMLENPIFAKVAEQNGITPEQLMYKFAQLEGIVPLSGTTDIEHMDHDLAVEGIVLKTEGMEKQVDAVRQFLVPH